MVQKYGFLTTMGTKNKTKINRLINQWTTGAPGATSYLNASGFGRDLLVKYKKSDWLEPFGRGAYIRSGDYEWSEALRKERNIGAHAIETEINRQDANDIPDFAVAICEYVYVLTDKYNTYLSCKENSEKQSS